MLYTECVSMDVLDEQCRYIYIYIYVYIYIYILCILSFKDVDYSFFTSSSGGKQIFAAVLALPPRSKIQLHACPRKVLEKTWFAWQVSIWRPSSFRYSKTFTFDGVINCERCFCQLKCGLKWLWDRHFAHKNITGLKLRHVHFVSSLDFKWFLCTYI